MKRILLSLMTTLFFTSAMNAQEEGRFVPGYYITTSQDTVRGYIANRYQLLQANAFLFRTTPDARDSRQLKPDEVERFFYEPNFHFRAMTVNKSGKEDLEFLRQLVNGYAELYQELGPGQPIYILTLDNGERLQLDRQDSIVEDHLKLDRDYLGKMKYLFRDCPSIVQNYRRIDYTQQMLARFVHNYNKCAHSDQNPEIYINREKLRISLGAQAGISQTFVDGSSGLPTFDGSGSGWSAGVLLEFYFLRQVALRTGVHYYSYTTESNRTFSLGTDNFQHEVNSLEIPVNFKFQFHEGRFTPYLYAGMNIPLNFDISEQFTRTEFGSVTVNRQLDMQVERYLFTINGGVGVNFKISDRSVLFLNLDYDYKDINATIGSFRPQRFVLSGGMIF